MNIKSVPVTFKAGPEDGLAEGEFIVYPSTFTREPDAYGDVVAKGAFARGIEERRKNGINLPGLFGHRMDDPDFYVASATEEEEDDHGWRVRGVFDMDSPKGPQTYRLVKSGRLRELSFAYDTLAEGQVDLGGGRKANELRDLDVFEFSFVPVGANRDTSVVAVKSAVEALAASVKSGRVLSAKNEQTLRGVVDSLGVTITELKSVLSQIEAGSDQEKAVGQGEAKNEEPAGVKFEEPAVSPSVISDWERSIERAAFGSEGMLLTNPKEGELMNPKEKLAELLKSMKAIVDGAKALNRDLTDEEITTLEAKNEEVTTLKATIERQEKGARLIAAIGAQADDVDETPEAKKAPKAARSLGEHFVQSLKSAGASLHDTKFEASEFKAATDTQGTGTRDLSGAFGPLVTDVDRSFVLPKRERLVIADLLDSGSVSGNAITYPVFGALEGGTATVGEGGAKPQLHVADPTWRTDALGEVAGWFKITDDMAEDLDYVVSEINSTAIYDLRFKEEVQLLNGNGTAPNLRGILNRSGVQTHAQGTDSVADAIFKAIGKVDTATGFAADGIVINPTDYEALRLGKDANDQYYGGGYFAGQYGAGGLLIHPPLWGLRTVVTSAIAAGTVLTGAFSIAKVFRKGGLKVESTNSHADDFTNDKITIRVKERLGLQVKYPAAFVKVTLGA